MGAASVIYECYFSTAVAPGDFWLPIWLPILLIVIFIILIVLIVMINK